MAFNLKLPQGIGVALKGARGLTTGIFTSRPLITTFLGALERPIAQSAEVNLRPGEEVSAIVTLPDEIKTDASFTRIAAALLPLPDDTAPIQFSQRATVSGGDVDGLFDVDISVPTSPTNLSIRLQGGDAFWNFAATLTEARYNFPDIAEPVNLYLDNILTESGVLDLPIRLEFLIQSSGAGKARIGIYTIEYVRLKTESWPNDLDDTIRVDRNYNLKFAQVETILLEPPSDGPGLRLSSIRVDIGGEFGPERLLGDVVQHDSREFATINLDYALAQQCVLENAIRCAGVTALLVSENEAEVYFEIQNDDNGSPAAAKPLAASKVTLSPSETNGSGIWTFAPFDSPANLESGVLYWIVIKGIQSNVFLALQNQIGTYLGTTQVNRGGYKWKPLPDESPSPLPLIRLVYLPDIDNQTAAITLRLMGTDFRLPFDPTPEAQNVTIQPPEDISMPVELAVESQAPGSLSIANIVQEYQVEQ